MAFATAKNTLRRIKFPNRAKVTTTYTARQLATRYGFPVVTSSNQFVAIIELANGYPLMQSDLQAYCSQLQIPFPSLQLIALDGALTNDPAAAGNDANAEIALDIQNVAGATGGTVGILVFFTPNTSQGFIDAVNAVAADGRACALSISWGQEEAGWAEADMQAMDAAFAACNSKGITCFAAQGDNGSADGGTGTNADYPGASPNCCGCGGTSIGPSSETAWSDTGGAYSSRAKQPTWQVLSLGDGNGMRACPDLAADGDPNSGYATIIEGSSQVIGGTSAVAPMMAALVSLIVTVTGKRLGLWLPQCYHFGVGGSTGFTDITSGSNGAYQAKPGTDRCTGLGVPNAALIKAVIAANSVNPPPTPVPTPVPTPTPVPVPTPVPTPPPTVTDRQRIDQAFAQAEKDYPDVAGRLRQLQVLVDRYLAFLGVRDIAPANEFTDIHSIAVDVGKLVQQASTQNTELLSIGTDIHTIAGACFTQWPLCTIALQSLAADVKRYVEAALAKAVDLNINIH